MNCRMGNQIKTVENDIVARLSMCWRFALCSYGQTMARTLVSILNDWIDGRNSKYDSNQWVLLGFNSDHCTKYHKFTLQYVLRQPITHYWHRLRFFCSFVPNMFAIAKFSIITWIAQVFEFLYFLPLYLSFSL